MNPQPLGYEPSRHVQHNLASVEPLRHRQPSLSSQSTSWSGRGTHRSYPRMPWATAGDTTTATEALASRAEAAPAAANAAAGAREWLARHVGALAPVCQ